MIVTTWLNDIVDGAVAMAGGDAGLRPLALEIAGAITEAFGDAAVVVPDDADDDERAALGAIKEVVVDGVVRRIDMSVSVGGMSVDEAAVMATEAFGDIATQRVYECLRLAVRS